MSQFSSETRAELRSKRLFVLDLDGTTYLGNRLFPWTLPFLEAVKERGAEYLFLTNNSSRTGDDYVVKLRQLGIPVERRHVLTSVDATIDLLKREGRWKKLYLVATPTVEREFVDAGFISVGRGSALGLAKGSCGEEFALPDAVVLTFDMTLTYEKLEMACRLVRLGVSYVASHPDVNCPTVEGPIPDIGSFIALIEASTGRKPDKVVGKPNREFLELAMSRVGVSACQTVLIGDRLYTDIACGNAAGVTSVLVLSGESTREAAETSPHVPDLIVENLSELTSLLKLP